MDALVRAFTRRSRADSIVDADVSPFRR